MRFCEVADLLPGTFFVDSVRPTILVSQIDKIINSSIDGSEFNVLLGNLGRAVALDYHYQKKLIFFTDVQDKSIYRITYEGKEVKVILIWVILRPGLVVGFRWRIFRLKMLGSILNVFPTHAVAIFVIWRVCMYGGCAYSYIWGVHIRMVMF